MIRRAALLGALLATAGLLATPPVASAAAMPALRELGPLISGQSQYVKGAHVWTGYA